MYGLVQTMTYIRFFTTYAYDIRDIFFLSVSLLELVLEDNLQLIGSLVEIFLQSSLLKCHKIFGK